MVIRNYGKFINGYPQYLRLPIQLTADITINGVVHPAGSWLSTDNESAILELGYKPIIRSEMPEKEGVLLHRKMDGYRGGNSAGMGGARTAPGYRLYRSPRYYDGRKSMIVRTVEEARVWRANN